MGLQPTRPLTCLGPTVSGPRDPRSCALNRQQEDWTADYRFYSRGRVQPQALFTTARQSVEAALRPEAPLVVGVDDSLLPKRGRRIQGTAWRRDPLGPPFQVQFTWAQRVLQFSAARPLGPAGAVRMVPIDFVHAPTPAKPRQGADDDARAAYRQAAKQANLVALAQRRLVDLRAQVPAQRLIHVVGDGRYSNKTLLRKRLPGTVYIGRIRKDSALFQAPPAQPATGRKRIYGARALTPEQLRQAEDQPWGTINAYACGKVHEFQVKVLAEVRSPLCGNAPVLVVVIKPLGYRLRQGGKLLYRRRLISCVPTRVCRWHRWCRSICGGGISRSTSARRRRWWGWGRLRCDWPLRWKRCRPWRWARMRCCRWPLSQTERTCEVRPPPDSRTFCPLNVSA